MPFFNGLGKNPISYWAFRTVGTVALATLGNMLPPLSCGHGYAGVAVTYGHGGRPTIGQRRAVGACSYCSSRGLLPGGSHQLARGGRTDSRVAQGGISGWHIAILIGVGV